MTVLVFGAAGQVGQELLALAAARGVAAQGVTRQEADLRDAAAVNAAVLRYQPHLVVNAAAYTAVDKAESEPELAAALNINGAAAVARAAAVQNVPLVHLSTDYVFDGAKTSAYREDDPISPLGIYGRTKAEGEGAVRSAHAAHIILRTAWVFGAYRANFLKTMLRLAAERDRMRVVADQRGCPTSTRDIAEAVLAVEAAARRGQLQFGTYHFAGSGVTTWHGFAEAIVAAQAPLTGRHPPVDAITTSDYPTAAKRPSNSELDSSLFERTYGYRAADWQLRTREVVATLLGSAAEAQA